VDSVSHRAAPWPIRSPALVLLRAGTVNGGDISARGFPSLGSDMNRHESSMIEADVRAVSPSCSLPSRARPVLIARAIIMRVVPLRWLRLCWRSDRGLLCSTDSSERLASHKRVHRLRRRQGRVGEDELTTLTPRAPPSLVRGRLVFVKANTRILCQGSTLQIVSADLHLECGCASGQCTFVGPCAKGIYTASVNESFKRLQAGACLRLCFRGSTRVLKRLERTRARCQCHVER